MWLQKDCGVVQEKYALTRKQDFQISELKEEEELIDLLDLSVLQSVIFFLTMY